jgi:hypothetical protein
MAELGRIFFTAGLTLGGGVLLLVAGQLLVHWVVEPSLALRAVKGKIAYALMYYANVYMNPGTRRTARGQELERECTDEFRRLGAELSAAFEAAPKSRLWSRLGVRRKQEIGEAVKNLILLSNLVLEHETLASEPEPGRAAQLREDARKARQAIQNALGIQG